MPTQLTWCEECGANMLVNGGRWCDHCDKELCYECYNAHNDSNEFEGED